MSKHTLEIHRNAEGDLLAYLSPEDGDCGFRIAGPKAWGGSTKIVDISIEDSDLIEYLRCFVDSDDL